MNPDSNEQSRILSENRQLNRQLEIWKLRAAKLSQDLAKKQIYQEKHKESEAFSKMQQELEDLRINYRETMRQNLIYEQRLAI
jgi:hypothetical protein